MRYRTLALSIAGLSTLIVGPALSSFASPDQNIKQVDQSTHPTTHPEGTLTTSHSAYAKGETVKFVFVIQNPSQSSIHYDFSTAQQFDITVVDPHGVEIWKWSQDRMFAQALTAIDLKAGESKVYTAEWDTGGAHFLPVGTYTASAALIPTIRPAVRGGMLVSPDIDPNNMGRVTRGRIKSGSIVEVNVTPGISATAKFTIANQ